jgi:hypothetical protein
MQTRKPRGPNKAPTLIHISVRISKEANAYYSQNANRSQAIRNVLEEHAKKNTVV